MSKNAARKGKAKKSWKMDLIPIRAVSYFTQKTGDKEMMCVYRKQKTGENVPLLMLYLTEFSS